MKAALQPPILPLPNTLSQREKAATCQLEEDGEEEKGEDKEKGKGEVWEVFFLRTLKYLLLSEGHTAELAVRFQKEPELRAEQLWKLSCCVINRKISAKMFSSRSLLDAPSS